MKIIHTSDWHLGHKLYNWDRSDEEAHFFNQLTGVVRQEQPDALLVSGDVFHTGYPGNDVAKKFTEQLIGVQAACPTMEIVITAGNHDSYSRLEVDQALWALHHVHIVGTPAEKEDGTGDFEKNLIKIGDKGIVAAIPFCHARNFPIVNEGKEDDRFKAYFKGLRKAVETNNSSGLPVVLMAHLAVGRDTDISGQEKDDVDGSEARTELSTLGKGYDYIALGHIHFAQWVDKEQKRVRYCGTPRPIHFDERHQHGVDIVEITSGRELQWRTIKLKPVRKLETIGGSKGLVFNEALEKLTRDNIPEDAYIRLNVAMGKDEQVGADWTETARKIAVERKLRFCLINPVREENPEEEQQGHAEHLTMEQIRELSNEDVLRVLDDKHKLSVRQKEMLLELLSGLEG